MPSDAYNRFIASMKIDYEKWHDGEGYDLSVIDDLTPAERRELIALLRGRDDWRDAEALAALQLDRSLDQHDAETQESAVREKLDSTSAQTRIKAIEALHDSGRMSDAELEEKLLHELKVVRPYEGVTQCFFLLDRLPTERIKRRLLWCTFNRSDEGPIFAGKLWQLCGKSAEEFDWSMRPLFLKFGTQVSSWEKHKAVQEFCQQIGMDAQDAQ